MAKLVSKTYGDALFDVAVEDNTLDALLAEVEAVTGILHSNEEYIGLLSHPRLAVEEKVSLIEKAFKGNVSDTLLGFLMTITSKGRFTEIFDILDYFTMKVWEEKKIGVAYITSAKELSSKQKKEIEEKLLATTKYVEFRMNYAVDESLIGGLVIRIGDRVVDSSVKTKLANMAKELSKIQLKA